jgi:hypothetical protein
MDCDPTQITAARSRNYYSRKTLGIPLSIACTLGGSILFGLEVFHHQRKPSQPPSATCMAVEEIASRIRVFP